MKSYLLYIVVIIAAFSAAVGDSFLSFGMKRHESMNMTDPSHWFSLIFSVIKNPYVFMGVCFLAVFFFLYLAALSWADLSFVLPLTALSYLFAVVLAKYFLNEDVSWYRWIGTVVIVVGVALVALDKPKSPEPEFIQNPAIHEVQDADEKIVKSDA
ncbi:MAG: EamA family transporter [Nitrospirota bacterium]